MPGSLRICMTRSPPAPRAHAPRGCSPRGPALQDAVLAAEELAWDKKMSALRQPATKGPSPGNAPVEQTEEDPEVVAAAPCVWPLQRVPITRATPGRAVGVGLGRGVLQPAAWPALSVCCCQDEESASDDFMEPNNRTDGSQALEDWDIDGMGAEPDDFN